MYPIPAFAEPPTSVSASTETVLFATSIDKTWFLNGTTSFESGFTVTSNTVVVAPLMFSKLDMFRELIITWPVE